MVTAQVAVLDPEPASLPPVACTVRCSSTLPGREELGGCRARSSSTADAPGRAHTGRTPCARAGPGTARCRICCRSGAARAVTARPARIQGQGRELGRQTGGGDRRGRPQRGLDHRRRVEDRQGGRCWRDGRRRGVRRGGQHAGDCLSTTPRGRPTTAHRLKIKLTPRGGGAAMVTAASKCMAPNRASGPAVRAAERSGVVRRLGWVCRQEFGPCSSGFGQQALVGRVQRLVRFVDQDVGDQLGCDGVPGRDRCADRDGGDADAVGGEIGSEHERERA